MHNITKTLRRLSAMGGAAAVAIHVVRQRMAIEAPKERRSDTQPAPQQPPATRERTYGPSSSVGFPLPTVLNPIKETVDAMGTAAFDACPQATQLAVALIAATHEHVKSVVSPRRSNPVARHAEAAAFPYQGLEAQHPGLSHPLTRERAAGRTPQYYLTAEQFVKLAEHNPIVAWIARNAKFMKAGTCHGEAFAQVRRMGGIPEVPGRLNWEKYWQMATDFQQITPDGIAAALSEGGVVVLNGTGQLVAEDSYQRSVESGEVDKMYFWNMNRIKESEGEVNHSVMLIDDPSGLVPKDYVLVYDPDPFIKRLAHLHDPRTGRPVSSSGPLAPSVVVPESDMHKLLRIVHLDDLVAETYQAFSNPKAMRPLFSLPFPLPQAPSGGPQAGEPPVQLHVGSKLPSG